jgi:hypothetical protein
MFKSSVSESPPVAMVPLYSTGYADIVKAVYHRRDKGTSYLQWSDTDLNNPRSRKRKGGIKKDPVQAPGGMKGEKSDMSTLQGQTIIK